MFTSIECKECGAYGFVYLNKTGIAETSADLDVFLSNQEVLSNILLESDSKESNAPLIPFEEELTLDFTRVPLQKWTCYEGTRKNHIPRVLFHDKCPFDGNKACCLSLDKDSELWKFRVADIVAQVVSERSNWPCSQAEAMNEFVFCSLNQNLLLDFIVIRRFLAQNREIDSLSVYMINPELRSKLPYNTELRNFIVEMGSLVKKMSWIVWPSLSQYWKTHKCQLERHPPTMTMVFDFISHVGYCPRFKPQEIESLMGVSQLLVLFGLKSSQHRPYLRVLLKDKKDSFIAHDLIKLD